MENLNGGLGFKATLDIDDFNVSAQAMEKQIRHLSTTTQAEAADMEDSLLQFAQRGAAYITSYLVGQGMMGLLQSIAQVRGQFQQLEIAFETMLGSTSKAQTLMSQMVDTAAKTPFDLMGVASGAKQLLAYGAAADKVNDTLVRLGNIASGLSIPLNDIVYLYGTTMVQGRLYAQDVRQFTGRGIPLVRELAEMYGVTTEKINEMVSAGKIGYPDVEKVINKLTNAGGQFYNLMEKQSASLTGMISNLGDAWDSMLNEIGKQNQDVFAGAIGSASYLVENYEEILRVLKAVALGYGSVKAAIVLNTLATKGYTGVALVDNTVRSAKLALLKMDATLTGTAKAQTEAMAAAEKAHVASLQAELTSEELVNLQKRLRITTIASLLTAQQQEYLSNIGLTTSLKGYEEAALSIMTVEQQEALNKTDLTAKSAIYKSALEQEVAAKRINRAATLEAMRADVSAAAATVEAAKRRAVAATATVEQARLNVYWAKASGNATAIAAAEKKLEAAVEQQSITRKAALTAQNDFYTKKKALEAAAVRQSTAASVADTTAKTTQTAATSLLAAATNKATLAVKTLWTAIKANPLGWILSILGLVVSAFSFLKSSTDENTTAAQEFATRTKAELDTLKLYLDVLQNTDASTKLHKDTLEKINAIAKEYNTTLLNENDSLAEQKQKYDELTKSIQQTTAEKIIAKKTEEAYNQRSATQSSALESLQDQAGNARYISGTNYSPTTGAQTYEWSDSESIQGASKEFWEMMEAFTLEEIQKMKDLTGKEYGTAFNQLISDMEGKLKNVLGATDGELDGFRNSLIQYANDIAQSERTAAQEINQVKSELEKFITTAKKTDVSTPVDYTKMSFEELKEAATNARKEIEKINGKTVRLDVDMTRLKELQGVLTQVDKATKVKDESLNTESDINARIKTLKEEKEQAIIGGTEYKRLETEIATLQDKLPKTGEQAAQKMEALNQRQIEAQRAAEEARIATMEEGFAKRKAVLALQHQRSLDQIDKDEKELIAARKKAGKGGLSDNEQQGFADRREAENATFQRSQSKLFDGEIEYKKKQYELYFQWVKNVGKSVADSHFATLLKQGSSFSGWVQSQITELEAKQSMNPESFSDGDANALNQLKGQYNELTGAKSAMDLFRESVQQTIGQAGTLAEKLQAIADLKDQLNNDGFGLNEDEKVQAAYSLDEQDAEYQKELRQRILNDYQTYEERKRSIQAEYAAMRLTDVARNNQEILDKLNEGEAAALSSVQAEQLQASDNWQNLFRNLDYMTAREIQKLVDAIEHDMKNAKLSLSPVDYQALTNSLNEAKKKITTLSPFKSLGDNFKKYQKSLKDLRQAEKENLSKEKTEEYRQNVINSAKQCTAAIGQITQTTGSIGSTIAGVADSFGADGRTSAVIQGVTGALEGAGKAAGGVSKIMSGDLIGGITDVISGIGDFIMSLNGMSDALHEENIKDLQKEIDALAESYDDLGDSIEHAFSSSKADLIKQQNENLKKQNELIKQQIQEEEDKKKTDEERIEDWKDQIKENEKQIVENEKYNIIEAIMGTEVQSAIDSLANAYADAWTKGSKAAGKSADTVKNLIKTAIIEQLKNKLQPEVETFMNYLSNALQDGILSESEENMISEYQKKMDDISQKYLEKAGKWLDTEEEDALSGAVKSMSEETGGILAGRMNAVVINQSAQQRIMQDSLIYQAQIAQNTQLSAQKLSSIDEAVKRLENRESSLLSQGIS